VENGFDIGGYKAGALAEVVRLHMAYYHTNWGFGLAFETKVAGELAEFMSRFNQDSDLFLTVYSFTGECVASISLDSKDVNGMGAHVRWFVVDDHFAGQGIGRMLMRKVIEHCDRSGDNQSYLTTFEGLHVARKLYESFGFKLTEERYVDQWAGGVKEQLFVRDRRI
jgi:GNAT superfamily N-acetyltransferase